MTDLEAKQIIQDLFPWDDVTFTHKGGIPDHMVGKVVEYTEWCIYVEDVTDEINWYHVTMCNGKVGLSHQNCQQDVLGRLDNEVELPEDERAVPYN
jgi:hypothetical protein